MKNTTLTLSLVETELTRLYMILEAISHFANNLEKVMPADTEVRWGFDKTLAAIARATNPELPDAALKECARLPIFTLAAKTAANTSFTLLSALKLAQGAPTTGDGISADILIKAARQGRTGKYEDREDLIQHLPWLIQSVLDYLCNDIDYQHQPNSGSAVAMRLLASIVYAMEVNGFEVTESEEEIKRSVEVDMVMEARGRYGITREPVANPMAWAHAQLN